MGGRGVLGREVVAYRIVHLLDMHSCGTVNYCFVLC